MTTWEVIKTLLRQTGFYQKKFIFFLFLVVITLTAVLIWQRKSQVEAAIMPSQSSENLSSDVKFDVKLSNDGDVLINGTKYAHGVNFLRNYDELSIIAFKATGRYVNTFEAVIHLPEPVEEEKVRQIIHAAHGVGSYNAYVGDSQTLYYQASEISPQASLTLVARFPKGYLKPGRFDFLKFTLEGWPIRVWLYVAIVLPLITIILMAFMILKRRADQIIPVRGLIGQPPSTLPPAVVGVLTDGTIGAREIAATLLDLARRGYIFIINKGEGHFSFGIRRTGELEEMPGLAVFEKVLLSKIFLPKQFRSTPVDIEMRIGRHIFSRKIAQFYLDLYNQATKEGYFVKNPAKVHLVWKYIGVILFFLSFLGFVFGAIVGADPKFGLFFWVGGMAAALVIIKLSPYMPARSLTGTKELRKWLAFRKYLCSRELFVSEEIIQDKFEEYLPYAIVLGAEVDWISRFGQEPFAKPEWYESNERAVTMESFAGELFPLIGYVAKNLARSHEPTVE